ncbi:MAG: citrate/2-methylcitrate synthase [Desulfobacca sp.]|uniref:citrate/2-methylcitrate synthase n=1 Tax=Desulfobacca sp. TaxID=2067990 RepID=UPI004049C376
MDHEGLSNHTIPKAILQVGAHAIELPLICGSEGEVALDIRNLRNHTKGLQLNGKAIQGGLITFDPGYKNTASCRSDITFIDGERGILRYRGYDIAELAQRRVRFIETALLLIYGELPTPAEREYFRELLTQYEMLHEGMINFFSSLPPNGDPMAILAAAVQCSSLYNPELRAIDPADEESFRAAAAKLLSKVRTIAAFSYRTAMGLPFEYPDPSLDYCSNFLHMMFSIPYRRFYATEAMIRALNLFLILHADHEQNCSTATVRMVGSSRANLFDSISAGISALSGPLHGGANVQVIRLLESIARGEETISGLLASVKTKEPGKPRRRLPGFGHRIYRNYDPRAKILKEAVDNLLAELQFSDPLLDIARELEERVTTDAFFQQAKLYPNIDFYSGILLRAIQIPVNMFTLMFAIGRVAGWIAQWREEALNPEAAIQRPRQVYIGKQYRSLCNAL